MLKDMARRNEESKAAETAPQPKLEPLAVVPSGLYPDAEVRRGEANRWELWAPD